MEEYVCPLCTKALSTKQRLLYHLSSKIHNVKDASSFLNLHRPSKIPITTSGEKFNCPKCSKTFRYKTSI